MNAPPPLPRTGFVTVLGRISLLLAVLVLAGSLLQAVFALLLSDDTVARFAAHPAMPPAGAWMLEQRRLLSLLGLALAVLFLASSWGLLRRLEWARWGFIGFLVASATLNFASLPLAGQFFDGMVRMFPAEFLDTPDGREFLAQMKFNRAVSLATATLTSLAFAALHGYVAWKLCTPEVRAEFGRTGQD